MKVRIRFSRRWLVLPPVLLGVMAVVLFAASRRELVRVPAAEQATPLQVIRAKRSRIAAQATGFGTARPKRVWSAVVEVSGKIVQMHPSLRSGNRVAKDELLLKIDDLDYRLRVSQREADLAAARAGVDELLANEAADRASLEIEEDLLRVTEKELRRLDQLQRTSAASQSEKDRAEGDLLRQTASVQQLRKSLSVLPARIASAKASVALAESRLNESKRDLERTEIVAPFSGVLSGVDIESGQVVALSSRLFELHDTDNIEIDAQFSPSKIIPLLRGVDTQGQSIIYASLRDAIDTGRLTATVTARSGRAEVSWPGTPLRVSESIDPSTRTLGIVIDVDNTQSLAEPMFAGRPLVPNPSMLDQAPEGTPTEETPPEATSPDDVVGRGADIRLFPGLYCEVNLASVRELDSIAIPGTAADEGTVYIVNDQDRLAKRRVSIAYTAKGRLVISEGIEEGELVAIKPPLPAIEGMLVIPEVLTLQADGSLATLPAGESR